MISCSRISESTILGGVISEQFNIFSSCGGIGGGLGLNSLSLPVGLIDIISTCIGSCPKHKTLLRQGQNLIKKIL